MIKIEIIDIACAILKKRFFGSTIKLRVAIIKFII
jgi:hypothetical protein